MGVAFPKWGTYLVRGGEQKSGSAGIGRGLLYLASAVTEIFMDSHRVLYLWKRNMLDWTVWNCSFCNFILFSLVVNITYLFLINDDYEDCSNYMIDADCWLSPSLSCLMAWLVSCCFRVCARARVHINTCNKIYCFSHFTVYDSVAFGTFPMQCGHHVCLVPERFHHPKRRAPTRWSSHFPSLPPNPGNR